MKKTGMDLMREAHELVNVLMETGGEASEQIDQALDQYEDDIKLKMGAYRAVIKAFEHRGSRLREEAAIMNKMARRLAIEGERVKSRAMDVMLSRCELHGWDEGRKTQTSSDTLVFLSKRTRVKIDDEEQFIMLHDGSDYVQKTMKVKIDKDAIKRDMKSDDSVVVVGVEMEEFTTISFK